MRHSVLTLVGDLRFSAAAGAVGGWYLFAEPATERPRGRWPAGTVPVETAVAMAGHAATLIRATGTLRASDSVVVQPEIAGRVTAVLFEQGEAVAAGTPMIKLAPETLQAELVKAEAALVLARENYARSEALSRPGATAAQALDEARANLRTAEAEVDLARVRLAHTDIAAPFDGVVGAQGDQRRPLCRARRRAGGAGADRPALSRFPPVGALADQAGPGRAAWRSPWTPCPAGPSTARSQRSIPGRRQRPCGPAARHRAQPRA